MKVASSVDQREIDRFSRAGGEWWAGEGPFAALHRINPVRLKFIRDRAAAHFGRDAQDHRPLEGLAALDIGCGGGILCEPLARLGAEVTGIDPSTRAIVAARAHMETSGLEIDYRETTAEAVAASGKTFDMVLAMEVIEHVTDPAGFMATAASLVAPGGLMFAATINRTLKAFALAIVGAEYVLGWVERGTHSFEKFVTPAELEAALGQAGFQVNETAGLVYNPFAGGWQMGRDTDVNYMMAASRGAETA